MMTAYNLSVVIISPDVYRQAVNAYAKSCGWGDNNLSIELQKEDGSIWWGCHAWAAPSFLQDLSDLSNDPDNEYAAALASTVISVVPDGVPDDNWNDVLSQHGLIPKEINTLV